MPVSSGLNGAPDTSCPDFAKRTDIPVDYWRAFILDAKFPTRDCANWLNIDVILCRNRTGASKRRGRDRYHNTRAALAEKREFGSFVRRIEIERDFSRKSFTAEAGFRESNSKAPVADIVGGENYFRAGELNQAFNEPLFSSEI